MDDPATTADPLSGSQRLPVIVIVNDQVLPRSCIVNILKRELAGFEIAEMATTGDLCNPLGASAVTARSSMMFPH